MRQWTTSVPADAEQLPALTEFLGNCWSDTGLPAEALPTFELALEEVFMNVVMHGCRGNSTPQVGVSLTLVEGGATLSIADDGPAFDPLALPAPDLTASLEARPVGGLGVFLVRRLMDTVSYEHRGQLNMLQMTKRWRGPQYESQ